MTCKTTTEIIKELRGMVTYERTASKLAKDLGVSRSYLSEVLSGRKEVGPAILRGMGYDPEPRYVRAD